jgi:addiction module RelB/DinJ family antitoxin
MPKNIQEAAEKIFKDLGIDRSTAIRIFYVKVIDQQGIPFLVKKQQNKMGVNDLSEQEEKAFQRYVINRGMAELWESEEDALAEDFYNDTPPLR